MLTEKDYCDYDTCVALKDLGYDDPTDLRYNNSRSLGDFLGGIKAPTLYEAQKWLREEKKTEIVILGQNSIGGPYYPDIYTEDGLMNNAKGYKTYEEALSEGINEAVKILKEIENGE